MGMGGWVEGKKMVVAGVRTIFESGRSVLQNDQQSAAEDFWAQSREGKGKVEDYAQQWT